MPVAHLPAAAETASSERLADNSECPECPAHSFKCPAHSSKCPVHGSECPTHISECPAHSSQSPAYSSQCPAHSSQRSSHRQQCFQLESRRREGQHRYRLVTQTLRPLVFSKLENSLNTHRTINSPSQIQRDRTEINHERSSQRKQTRQVGINLTSLSWRYLH